MNNREYPANFKHDYWGTKKYRLIEQWKNYFKSYLYETRYYTHRKRLNMWEFYI